MESIRPIKIVGIMQVMELSKRSFGSYSHSGILEFYFRYSALSYSEFIPKECPKIENTKVLNAEEKAN